MFNAGSGLSAQVVDLGHTFIRAGYAGEDLPRSVEQERYFSEKTWRYEQLSGALARAVVPESPVLVTESGAETTRHREWLLSEIFENFRAPAVFVAKRPVLAAFAQGKISAHVLHAGGASTQYSVVTSGWLEQSEISWVGGNDVDLEISKHLPPSCPELVARQLKEEICRVREVGNSSQKFPTFSAPITLPDGTLVDTGLFAYASELLFPSSFFPQFPITAAVDVVLSGGSSLTTNYALRAQAELGDRKFVRAFPQASEQRHAAFLGASILGSLGAFPSLMVSRAEFLEYGPGVVHKKCP